jgi:hypothetical protein
VADFNQINQFGSVKPVRSGEGTSCAECEAMLMDAQDGILTPMQQAAFDLHIATCAECAQMLADAKRGASLLEMLKSPRPEPSSALLERILTRTIGTRTIGTQTIGAQTIGLSAPSKSMASVAVAFPAGDGAPVEIHGFVPGPALTSNVIPFPPRPASRFSLKAITRTMMQPRLAMTAAMAFFSITLTLNLTGVHISELRASDLSPTSLKHTFYHANASVVRYYDNLRVVYELESRVNELKRTNEGDNPHEDPMPALEKAPSPNQPDRKAPGHEKPRKAPKSGSGTSERLGTPLDPQFKLACDLRAPRPSRLCTSRWAGPANGDRTLAPPVNKLKERLQEGDLV